MAWFRFAHHALPDERVPWVLGSARPLDADARFRCPGPDGPTRHAVAPKRTRLQANVPWGADRTPTGRDPVAAATLTPAVVRWRRGADYSGRPGSLLSFRVREA